MAGLTDYAGRALLDTVVRAQALGAIVEIVAGSIDERRTGRIGVPLREASVLAVSRVASLSVAERTFPVN